MAVKGLIKMLAKETKTCKVQLIHEKSYCKVSNQVSHKWKGGNQHEGTTHSNRGSNDVNHPYFMCRNKVDSYGRANGENHTGQIGQLKKILHVISHWQCTKEILNQYYFYYYHHEVGISRKMSWHYPPPNQAHKQCKRVIHQSII